MQLFGRVGLGRVWQRSDGGAPTAAPMPERSRGRRGRRALGVSLLAGALGAAVLPLGASAHGSAVGRTQNVLPAPLLAHRIGAPPAGERWRVAIALADPNLAAERALADAVVDPSSPQFHKFLTPQTWAARFALPAGLRARTESWLRKGGLDLGYVSPTGDLVQAEGTVSAIERLFDVHLRRYRAASTEFLANDRPPAVPADIPVASVIGLNNLQRFVPGKPQLVRPELGMFAGVIDVKSLWTAYNAPASDEGQGVRMGVFMAGNTEPVIGSLRIFEATEHLPRVPVRVVHTEPGPDTDFAAGNDGGGEWMLDTQAATGMAPRVAGLDLYTSKSLADADALAEFSYWANDTAGPALMNASFGSCEDFPITAQNGIAGFQVAFGNMIQTASEKALMQAFAEGRTLFASSGDSGSSCSFISAPIIGAGNGLVNQVNPAQTYPATSPWVTGVGGTVLAQNKDGSRSDEQSWAFGGGGSALFIPEPEWQKSEPHVNRPCGPSRPDGTAIPPGTICRGVPDLAAVSGNAAQGLAIVNYDQPAAVGGTSLSSPLTMGIWARVAAAAKTPLGPAAPAIYHLSPDMRARDFHQIIAGEALGNGLYFPGPGWNYNAGYGVPDMTALTTDLAGSTVPAHPKAGKLPETPQPAAVDCMPFGTSPAGNITPTFLGQSNDARDLTYASMKLSDDGKSLVITARGPHLASELAPVGYQASFFNIAWTFHGEPYLVSVTRAAVRTKAVSQKLSFDRESTKRPESKEAAAVFSAGTLTVTVPLTDVDSPGPGDRLEYPVATSGVTVQLVVLALPDVQDVAGGDRDVVLSQHCS